MSHTWEGGFHETATGYYAAVGYLCHQWNNVEHFVYTLAAESLRLPNNMRTVLFRHMGVTSAISFINEYAEANFSEEAQKALAYATTYADRCRINRNLIVHGFPENTNSGVDLIRSVPDKNRPSARLFPITIEAVRQVCRDCETAGMLLVRGQLIVAPDEIKVSLRKLPNWPEFEKVLHARPPLPVLLTATPQTSPKPQPQP